LALADDWVVERVPWLELAESPDRVDARLRRWFPGLTVASGSDRDRKAA
jgi:hypothetical protein